MVSCTTVVHCVQYTEISYAHVNTHTCTHTPTVYMYMYVRVQNPFLVYKTYAVLTLDTY